MGNLSLGVLGGSLDLQNKIVIVHFAQRLFKIRIEGNFKENTLTELHLVGLHHTKTNLPLGSASCSILLWKSKWESCSFGF